MRGELEKYPEVSFIDSLSFHDFLGEIIRNYEEKYRELTGEESALPAAARPVCRLSRSLTALCIAASASLRCASSRDNVFSV